MVFYCLLCDFGEYCVEYNLIVIIGIVEFKFQEYIFIFFLYKKIIWILYNVCILYLNFNGYFFQEIVALVIIVYREK